MAGVSIVQVCDYAAHSGPFRKHYI